jgi:cytochrome c oxidase subunit 2
MIATLIWVVATAIGIVLLLVIGPQLVGWGGLPPIASARAADIDQVLGIFTFLSIPVFMLVVVYAGYSVFAFRTKGRPTVDGPAVRGNLPMQGIWIVVSICLVAFLFVYGVSFLNAVQAAPGDGKLVVHVNGEQWLWDYTYPQYNNLHTTTLELPVNRPVEFDITSTDVQHSFWIPALGIKQDAVPGETTHISVTPTVIGAYEVRCAELCGIYHSYMETPVQVVSADDFQAWTNAQQAAQPSSNLQPGVSLVAALPASNRRPDGAREG